jgi:hypothetical protein
MRLTVVLIFALSSLSYGSDFQFSKDAQKLREKLPKTEDAGLKAVFDKKLIFYTEKEIPRAFQFQEGLHDAYHNISATQPVEPFGNANREFPWGNPAGTHRASIVKFGFVHLPKPIRFWDERVFRPVHPQYPMARRWVYPNDTIFGEVLLNKQGKVFEVRTRKKINNKWTGVNAFRPFVTREEYDAFVIGNGGDPGRPSVSIRQLKNQHPIEVINSTAAIDTLSAIDKKIVDKGLAQPFKSARDKVWISKAGYEGYAPTTNEEYHIVPKNFDGGFVAVDSKSCARCHDSTMKDASYFEPVRDWYGMVRGDDNIMSFHIFSKSSIRNDGRTVWPELNQQLVEAGLLKHWNSQ